MLARLFVPVWLLFLSHFNVVEAMQDGKIWTTFGLGVLAPNPAPLIL